MTSLAIMSDYLFVYGTLMRGHANPMARLLSERAGYIGAASICGRLYRVKHYPGLIASVDNADVVHGDLFGNCDEALITQLDVYEGCGPDDPHPQQYRREMVQVELSSGETVDAWTYLYNWPVESLARIMSGRFAG